ncbi:MAG: nitrite reductase (NAD(P)H) small subunit [Sphingomonadales bacterium]|nr:nitrite reductase (NAD(P)H) small subunit [Sphingomonadales bacterium]
MSETWHPVCAESALPAEDKATVRIGGWHVLVARTESGFHAVNDRCTHQAAALSGGRIRRGAVMCPLHGARFEIATGRCFGSGYRDLRVFPVRVQSGMVEVCVPDAPPGIDERPV